MLSGHGVFRRLSTEECHALQQCRFCWPRVRCLGWWACWLLIVFAAIVAVIVLNYGGIWFRAYMSSANISLLSLIGMSFRRVDARVIVQGKIMAVQAGIGQEKRDGRHHPAARSPLPGRRQRAERDQGDHRRPSGRHRPGLRPRRGHRPGRPRRARRRADQRLSQGDRLPRPEAVGHAPRSAPSPRTASS